MRLSTASSLSLSALWCFAGSSLRLSNHSVNVTRRRFFPFPFLLPCSDPDDDSLLLAVTNGDFVSAERASVNVSDPATDGVYQSSPNWLVPHWNIPYHIPQWRIGFLLPLPFRSAAPWPSACDALSHVTNWHFTWRSQQLLGYHVRSSVTPSVTPTHSKIGTLLHWL